MEMGYAEGVSYSVEFIINFILYTKATYFHCLWDRLSHIY